MTTLHLLLAAFLVSACGGDDDDPAPGADAAPGDAGPVDAASDAEVTDGVVLLWDAPAGELDAFPDDSFTRDDPGARTGLRVELTAERVPLVAESPPLFRQMFETMTALDGFGLTAGLYLRFDADLDPATLAGEVHLVCETAGGPAAWPFEHRLVDEAEDVVGQTLVVEPIRPLPPATRCLFALSDGARGADGRAVVGSAAMRAALAGRGDDRVGPRMAAAGDTLVALGAIGAASEVVGAVVFTTQSVHEDALAIAADVAGHAVVARPETSCTSETTWVRCEGSYPSVDYRGPDGVIAEEQPPETPATYDVRFTAWLPLERPGPFGGDALPTVVFGHGLGGDRGQAEALADVAAPMGIATIAIDALSHGDHPTATQDVDLLRILDFFGIDVDAQTFLPLVMRDHFRQSTYDKLQLLRLLEGGLDLDGDEAADLDPARLAYLGVSLGGIMGPELLALAPALQVGVLIVPGGRVGSIVSDGEMFSILIDAMRPEGTTDGDLERFFPILQTILDRGDAAVWATGLLDAPDARPPGLPPSAPHLLLGMVIDDDTVPNVSTRALARAYGIPLVPPVLQPIPPLETTAAAPVFGNGEGGRTVGLFQFDRIVDDEGRVVTATHSNVGDSTVGLECWSRFLRGWLEDGVPVIVDPYAELGVP